MFNKYVVLERVKREIWKDSFTSIHNTLFTFIPFLACSWLSFWWVSAGCYWPTVWNVL